jgi:hypothetical protein
MHISPLAGLQKIFFYKFIMSLKNIICNIS